MDIKVHIIKVTPLKGVAKRTGNAYEMHICECIVEQGDDRQIAEFTLPRDTLVPTPGQYIAEFSISVNRQDKRIGGEITGLRPASPGAKPATPSVQA